MKPVYRDPGDLRHRIALQQLDRSADDQTGGFTPVWTTYAENVAAQMTPFLSVQDLTGGAPSSMVRYRGMIRHRDDLVEGHRILYLGYRLLIRSLIDEDGTGRWQLFDCEHRG